MLAEAFESISATRPRGSVNDERERSASGGYFIWLDWRTVVRLKAAWTRQGRTWTRNSGAC